MSAEDRAAQRRIPDDQFNEILRVIRETVREEVRAEFEGRRHMAFWQAVPGSLGQIGWNQRNGYMAREQYAQDMQFSSENQASGNKQT